ncbi:DUF3732 domain-containing protein [Mesorhizobium sp. BR1-1-2]|nr:DUF3732 domain-containing protein [Mesorhizobium sp. BR1-1-2]MBZ9966934.1 DUF3732 domain-containing protein [Mesorhizobium sp. BR1-1-2]
MPDVGSDQNYLVIHIALAFALQRYFDETNAPGVSGSAARDDA